jgi:hypothetical protein
VASELAAHFPTRYGGAESELLLYYQQQQKRIVALCDFVLSGESRHLEAIKEIDEWLLEQNLPEIFDDGDRRNVLVAHRRRFGSACAALAENGYPRAQEMSLFDFNAAVDYLLDKQQTD